MPDIHGKWDNINGFSLFYHLAIVLHHLLIDWWLYSGLRIGQEEINSDLGLGGIEHDFGGTGRNSLFSR